AVLTYNFNVESFSGSGSFSFDDSSITGTGYEDTTVLNGIFDLMGYQYNLAGIIAVLYEGKLVGLNGYVGYSFHNVYSDEEEGWTFTVDSNATWIFANNGLYSLMYGYKESYCNGERCDSWVVIHDSPVSYSQVPEPLTMAGTALAFAGLVRLKQNKKKVS
ncbi:MAG TPA: PEP-CTERM sorting domain-containing protein, partial [Kamptonema sp.]|nr:PEP-CTERM sorting domain-containing protein [Kamptonema sp.]